MSQERWDVVLRYLHGPLARMEDQVYRGPVVYLGANPGPGGVSLSGYRGLDARHASISAYDGGTVAIAPIGSSQVRVAPHENQDWAEIQPIQHATYLSENCAVHLGPPERGITFLFVECRRLGVWEQQRILSEAAQAAPELQPTQVKELSTQKGIPPWFVGGVVVVGILTSVAVLVPLIRTRAIADLGPTDEGEEYYVAVSTKEVAINTSLREGLDQPWVDFVMGPNALAAGDPKLAETKKEWDGKLLDYVTRSFQVHIKGWAFFKRLESVKEEWAYVLDELRDAGLPDVFAAIPYRESQYRGDVQSFVCANGWWQMMPETALRVGVQVSECKMRGSPTLWRPVRMIPVFNVVKRAEYVSNGQCQIINCAQDEREDLRSATRGAIQYLKEPWENPELRASGGLVQMAITSYNAGFDDSRFEEKKVKPNNVLPAYRTFLEQRKLTRASYFVGENVKCDLDSKTKDTTFTNSLCGALLFDQSQHYAYNIIAEAFLAACYFGSNYPTEPAFAKYKDYARGDGYCTKVRIPTSEEVQKRVGK